MLLRLLLSLCLFLLLIPRFGFAADTDFSPTFPGASAEDQSILQKLTDELARATALEEKVRWAADARDPTGWREWETLREVLQGIERSTVHLRGRPGEASVQIARWAGSSLATHRGILDTLRSLLTATLGPPGGAPSPSPISVSGSTSPWASAPSSSSAPSPVSPAPGTVALPPAGSSPAPVAQVASAPPTPASPPLPSLRSAAEEAALSAFPPLPGLPELAVAVVDAQAWAAAVGAGEGGPTTNAVKARPLVSRTSFPSEAVPLGPADAILLATSQGTLEAAGVRILSLAFVGQGGTRDRRLEMESSALDEARRQLATSRVLALSPASWKHYLTTGLTREALRSGDIIALTLEVSGKSAPLPLYFRLQSPASWTGVYFPVFFGVAAPFPGGEISRSPAFVILPSAATGVRLPIDAPGRHHLDVGGWLGLAIPAPSGGDSGWKAPGVAVGASFGIDGVAHFGFGGDFVNRSAVFSVAITPSGWPRLGISWGP